MKYSQFVRALIALKWSYDHVTNFSIYSTVRAAIVNDWISIWIFLYKEVLWTLEYPESFPLNERILVEILNFQKIIISGTKLKFVSENSRFF